MTRWQESTCLRAFSAQRVPWRREEWSGGRGGDQTGPRARERVTARVTECRGRRPVHSLTLVAHYVNMFTCALLHKEMWLLLLHYGWSVYLTLVKLSNSYTNKVREHVICYRYSSLIMTRFYVFGVIRLVWDQRCFKRFYLPIFVLTRARQSLIFNCCLMNIRNAILKQCCCS